MDKFLIDGQKLELHPERVAAWLAARDDWEKAKSVYPIYIEVSPIGACNHRCTFCSVDYLEYKPTQLDGVVMRNTLRSMAAQGVRSVMFAGEGEPLLHKEINAAVVAATGAGLDVSFTTNGVLLDKLETLSSCSWVKVSLNAGSRETYARVHRTKASDWDKVWENLRAAVKRKGKCTLGVQMVLLPENEREVENLRALGEDAGLDYVVVKPYIQNRYTLNRQTWQTILPPKSKGNLVVRERAMLEREHEYGACSATPYFWAYVMSNGDLYSCSAHLLDDRFRIGNINTQSFSEIWEGERRRDNWALMRDFDISACRLNCRMNQANKYLWRFDHQEHANFI